MRRQTVLLADKNAVIYGAGGLGAGIARTFAREGAKMFLAGRRCSTTAMTTLSRTSSPWTGTHSMHWRYGGPSASAPEESSMTLWVPDYRRQFCAVCRFACEECVG